MLRLNKEKTALFNEFSQNISKQDISITAKNLLIPHDGPRPIDEAISTAGGVPKNALDHNLMLKSKPGIFCAGEMLDWEAPTGGYPHNGMSGYGSMGRARGRQIILENNHNI